MIAAIVILNKNSIFPYPLDCISVYIALIQLLQIIIISFIKMTYIIYLLIKHPEMFEVRNSPLNQGHHI
jgi:hypothetical protein